MLFVFVRRSTGGRGENGRPTRPYLQEPGSGSFFVSRSTGDWRLVGGPGAIRGHGHESLSGCPRRGEHQRAVTLPQGVKGTGTFGRSCCSSTVQDASEGIRRLSLNGAARRVPLHAAIWDVRCGYSSPDEPLLAECGGDGPLSCIVRLGIVGRDF